jgi:hypothetical protein
MQFLNASGSERNAVHGMDFRSWEEEVNATIQAKTASGLNPEILGMPASIGIGMGNPGRRDHRPGPHSPPPGSALLERRFKISVLISIPVSGYG